MPVAICNSNVGEVGKSLEQIPIISFDKARELYNNLYIIITSTAYGDEIEQNISALLESKKIINIQPYFAANTLRENRSNDIQEKIEKHKISLRTNGNYDDLKKPEDIPEKIVHTMKALNSLQEAYKAGNDCKLVIDDYMVKGRVDFWNNSYIVKPMSLQEVMNCDEYNGVIKKSNGHLYNEELKPITGNIERVVENISAFSKYLHKRGISFLYVQWPNKISPMDTQRINGEMNLNEAASKILQGLADERVPILDYRQVMIEQNISFSESFFKTDHHWKPIAAFHATQALCNKIGDLVDIQFDPQLFELSNYECSIYPQLFLGGHGRRTGLLYAGVDDFELILPKYDTDYTWKCEEKNFSVRGLAHRSLLNQPHMDWCYYGLNPYVIYNIVFKGQCCITNHNARAERKIICLCDSFTRPVSSFLAPHFSELHFVDIRGELGKEDVFALIDKVKPDIVVMMHWPAVIVNNQSVSDINPYL